MYCNLLFHKIFLNILVVYEKKKDFMFTYCMSSKKIIFLRCEVLHFFTDDMILNYIPFSSTIVERVKFVPKT